MGFLTAIAASDVYPIEKVIPGIELLGDERIEKSNQIVLDSKQTGFKETYESVFDFPDERISSPVLKQKYTDRELSIIVMKDSVNEREVEESLISLSAMIRPRVIHLNLGPLAYQWEIALDASILMANHWNAGIIITGQDENMAIDFLFENESATLVNKVLNSGVPVILLISKPIEGDNKVSGDLSVVISKVNESIIWERYV